MSVGSCVGAASPLAVSEAAAGKDQVQGEAAVSILKKAMDIDASIVQTLLASVTGVGQNLDVSA